MLTSFIAQLLRTHKKSTIMNKLGMSFEYDYAKDHMFMGIALATALRAGCHERVGVDELDKDDVLSKLNVGAAIRQSREHGKPIVLSVG